MGIEGQLSRSLKSCEDDVISTVALPDAQEEYSFSSLLHDCEDQEPTEPPRKRRKGFCNDATDEVLAAQSKSSSICLADATFTPSHEPGCDAQYGDFPSGTGSLPVHLLSAKHFTHDAQIHLIELRGWHAPPRRKFSMLFNAYKGQENGPALDTAVTLSRLTRSTSHSLPLYSEASLERAEVGQQSNWLLRVRLFHKTGVPAELKRPYPFIEECLRRFMPLPTAVSIRTGIPTLQAFYEAAHVTDPNESVDIFSQNTPLRCRLFPFQQRAITWMLRREHARLGKDGFIEPYLCAVAAKDSSFCEIPDAHGKRCYVSHLLNAVYDDETALPDSAQDMLRGGLLAEEMGLGKTIELAALITAHRRPTNETFPETLVPSGATLIITPMHILEQWRTELAAHAPHLRVFHYKGARHHSSRDISTDELLQQDVVLSTYDVLSKEIYFANTTPNKALRHDKKYEKRKSPLVLIQWWRVCLDEAQMIEKGVSNAAQVAKVIPRCNAWAATGTPVKRNVEDLRGLLSFLHLEPYCQKNVFDRMLSGFQNVFADLFSSITLRHTKAIVHSELGLPTQNRFVINMPFTVVEEEHYCELYASMCKECGLDSDGGPLEADWNPDSAEVVEKMRSWLVRLRQACLHPEVGVRARRAQGHKVGPLRTVAEVLEVMIEQNETSLRSEERQALSARLLRGHIIYFGQDFAQAQTVYSEALEQSSLAVKSCREQLEAEHKKRALDRDARSSTSKNQYDDQDSNDDHLEDSDDYASGCTQRLRSALELQHACWFFVGTAFYSMKGAEDEYRTETDAFKQLEQHEVDAYEQAKIIRKELLKDTTFKTRRNMDKVEALLQGSITPVEAIAFKHRFGGIQSRRILSKIDNLVRTLNRNAKMLTSWRQKLTELLLVRLVDQDDGADITGEEYADSTKVQDKQYVYLFALRILVADRETFLTGQPNQLINHEIGTTLGFARSGEGHAPELMLSLLEEREQIRPDNDTFSSVRKFIAELRSMVNNVRHLEEASILEHELADLQELSSYQSKIILSLVEEINLFRSTMHARIDFHRQLQTISDTVVPWQEQFSDTVDLKKAELVQQAETKHLKRLAQLTTKRRYLDHLKMESTGQEGPRDCIICQSPFENGVLSVCGHIVCKECMAVWRSQNHNCPTCKRLLRGGDMHSITYKPKEIFARRENHESAIVKDSSKLSQSAAIYSAVCSDDLDEIQNVDLRGSYCTKIDTLARHLLWIRERSPTTQSVVFSQFRDFLNILGDALRQFKIKHVDASRRNSRKAAYQEFKEDSSVSCLLLDAKADSSGLNLTNARNVFICEPLINASIELQAIARVHRIGQRNNTTVWMYLVNDTIEEAVYDISVGRRLVHMERNHDSIGLSVEKPGEPDESILEAANSLELQANPTAQLLAKGKSGGELVAKDDLWQCLFAKPRRSSNSYSGRPNTGIDQVVRAEAAAERHGADLRPSD